MDPVGRMEGVVPGVLTRSLSPGGEGGGDGKAQQGLVHLLSSSAT